jgi:hypothetical protein
MPSVAPYIPAKNSHLVAWAENFATLIAASPATYGLIAPDSAAITAQNNTLQAAYTVISSPSTKTASAVAAFNSAKVYSLALFRPFAQQVSLNPAVSSANKTALGVNPRTSTPAPIPAPTTAPALTIQSTSTAGSILRYRDATASPSVKAKPFGVVQIQIFAAAPTTPISDPTLLPLVATRTKSPTTIAMGSANAGKTVYFAARWITRAGLVGPYSPIITYVIAG